MSLEEYIRQNLEYDPEAGTLIWLTNGTYNRKVGAIAGTAQKQKCGKWYVRVKIRGKSFGAHNVAWFLKTGCWPEMLIDHQDGNGLNNKWSNLRAASPEQNQRNRRLNANNKSGVSGVMQRSPTRWEVQIKGEGKLLYIGSFKTFDEAVQARRDAELKYGYHPNHGKKRLL